METYKIYALQDPISFKIKYIGITKQLLKLRLSAHMSRAKSSTKKWHRLNWLRSLQKLNKKPNIILIETLSSLEEGFKREIYWINYFNKRYKLTNTTKGGDGNKGFKWSKELYDKKSKKVKQYDKKGNLIKKHKSITEAAKYIKKPKLDGKIAQVCLGRYGRKTCQGYVWRYENDSFDKYNYTHNVSTHKSKEFRNKVAKRQKGSNNSFSKGVIQMDKESNIINKFSTVNEFLKEFNLKNAQWLKHCILNKKIYKGFYWKYE